MSKVTLIHPASSNPAKANLIWPPLGLCRIATYLEAQGHEVNIVEDALHGGLPLDEIYRACACADVVGIGAMTIQAKRVDEIVRALRGKVLVGGGPHFCAMSECPESFAAIVRGDGELGILQALDGRRGVIPAGPVASYVPIDFSHIDYPAYGDHLIDGRRAISILTSRGCPFECKFCGSPKLFGRQVLDYPLWEVVGNIFKLSGAYGIKAIRIMDDNFAISSKRVREFCLLVRGSGLAFACLTHVNTAREDDFKAMAQAGFTTVAIGAESGSKHVLSLAKKRVDPERVVDVVMMLKRTGIGAEVLFMLGLPGETAQSLGETRQLAERLLDIGVQRIHFQYFTPFPGCAYRDEILAGEHGVILDDSFDHFHHKKPTFLPSGLTLPELEAGAAKLLKLGQRNPEVWVHLSDRIKNRIRRREGRGQYTPRQLAWLISACASAGVKAPIDCDIQTGQTWVGGEEYSVIFPDFIVEKCLSLDYERAIKYNFIGKITKERKWVRKYRNRGFVNSAEVTTLQGFFTFDENYYRVLSASEFTLCPAGEQGWTYRFFEAALCGSIPVVDREDNSMSGYHYYLREDEHVYRADWAEENRRTFLARNTLRRWE